MLDEIVFEGRNKVYGAYAIRKEYAKNLFIGFFIMVMLVGSVVAMSFVKPADRVTDKPNMRITEVQLTEVKEDKVEEVKIEKHMTAPKTETIKFTVPVITENTPDDLPTNDDLELVNPGLITQEGDSGIFNDLPPGNDNETVIGGTNTQDDIFTVVEKMPGFPGGEEELFKFLDKHLIYPRAAKEHGIQGTVHVLFVVDNFGNIINVEIARGIGGGCDEEAIRVIELMPRWNPGENNGRKVSVRLHLPIKFSLE